MTLTMGTVMSYGWKKLQANKYFVVIKELDGIMRMVKVLPVNSCRECPKFQEEGNDRMCQLSRAKAYDLDDGWEDYLEQFCPLSNLDTVIRDAYEQGLEYGKFRDETIKEVKKSIEEDKWYTAHEYLEKINGK